MTKPKPLAFAAFALATCLTGCLHSKLGPQSLPRDRAAYSLSLSDSWKEETLLNIVKVRYIDPPIFVDVGSIVASYSLSQNASVGGTIVPNGSSNATLGGSVGFSNTPTITFTPLTGNAYIKGLITPLPSEVLFTAIQSFHAYQLISTALILECAMSTFRRTQWCRRGCENLPGTRFRI